MARQQAGTAAKFRYPEEDPRFEALQAKRRTLADRLAELEAELEEIPSGMSDSKLRAEALLQGRDPNVEEERAQRAKTSITRDIADHRLAIEMIDREADQLRGRLQVEYRRELMPDHARVSLPVAAALRGLADALEAELAFRDELDRHRIYHGSPMLVGTVTHAGRQGKEEIDFIRQQADEIEAAHKPHVRG